MCSAQIYEKNRKHHRYRGAKIAPAVGLRSRKICLCVLLLKRFLILKNGAIKTIPIFVKTISIIVATILNIVAPMILIVLGIKIGLRAKDRFGCFLSVGISVIIAVQVLLNVAVVTGSIPPTGLPLPFISAGSTSLMVFLGAIGVILNIDKQSRNVL